MPDISSEICEENRQIEPSILWLGVTVCVRLVLVGEKGEVWEGRRGDLDGREAAGMAHQRERVRARAWGAEYSIW